MSLRWDPLLVRHLARELHEALEGARTRALRLDGAARHASLLFREATLTWSLHPSGGAPRLLPAGHPAPGDLVLSGRVRRVRAPADERILIMEILPTRGRRSRDVIVELLGNQWNLLVTEGEESRIRHVLVRRNDRRVMRVGAAYEPPASNRREGCSVPLGLSRWHELLSGVAAHERPRALVKAVAWTSSVNASVLVPGEDDTGVEAFRPGYELWRGLAFEELPARPALLRLPGGTQPYPWPLPGMSHTGAASLLDAFEAWESERSRGGGEAGTTLLAPGLLAELEDALDRAYRRMTSLRAELAAAEDPARLRSYGNLLLARLRHVPTGVEEVVVDDFDGGPVTLRLDPRVTPQANAAAYYERAARAERARARLPGLLSEAEARATLLESLAGRARAGEVDSEEVRAALPDEERAESSRRRAPATTVPFRRYRSSGGLEIRVGRGARHNDELTFRHSSPNDVWLHARHAAGAHVVLRWGRAESPPARDLEEAAVLAALHSRARTSSSVPVDWTFRKYVRKPRGSPPGKVTMERAHTLFVTPDPEWEDRLATEGPA